ncbi:hypothetical protein Mal48_09430 [Thalassoglobus polymorphus]|uniref:Uncharacterized protein n=1 Tax=Thalassoglobus polymorphus TaxID=2527994 RepID=A0A517QJB4_9PLAN|nr:hypothetical protein Mal48_09430 [Thalassoglobus polymorphus]
MLSQTLRSATLSQVYRLTEMLVLNAWLDREERLGIRNILYAMWRNASSISGDVFSWSGTSSSAGKAQLSVTGLAAQSLIRNYRVAPMELNI